MNPYDRWVLPTVIDKACGIEPIAEKRRELVSRAKGRVLEIGVGTGHNLPFYDASEIDELIVLDPAEQMHAKAERRAAEAGIGVRMLGLSAEQIPLDAGSIDTVVCTFTLCSVPDAGAAAGELHRVLAADGRLIFCEHGMAPDAGVRRWQRRLNPIWGALGGGCHLDRDIPALLDAFDLGSMETGYIPGPRFAGYLYSGVAAA